jgi:hypothetical protein
MKLAAWLLGLVDKIRRKPTRPNSAPQCGVRVSVGRLVPLDLADLSHFERRASAWIASESALDAARAIWSTRRDCDTLLRLELYEADRTGRSAVLVACWSWSSEPVQMVPLAWVH